MKKIIGIFVCLLTLLTLSKSNYFEKGKVQHIQKSCLINPKEISSCLDGKIYQNFSVGYKQVIKQYATSSFPPEKMQPFMLIVAQNIEDIRKILRYAKHMKKKVVARSGGHQYSGLSSGGKDTICISMDRFNDLKLTGRNKVEIGPGVSVQDGAAFLSKNKLSLPHGECPLVKFGGHVQTGGYGRFLRSFGITADYVTAFDIVLANGEYRTISRPNFCAKHLSKQQLQDLKLFRGVLGGNAGSFGIVTKYYFQALKDEDHPNSWAFSKVRLFSKQKMTQCLQIVQNWTKKIAQKNESSIQGLQIYLSVFPSYNLTTGSKQGFIQFEGLYSDTQDKAPYKDQFKEILQNYLRNQNKIEQYFNSQPQAFMGGYPLSNLAKKFIRKQPIVTKAGREFDLPYKKRESVTFDKISDEFIKEIVNISNELQDPNKKSLVMVMQMLVSGGVYRKNGQRKVDGITLTSIPFRNNTVSFSFDVFYNTAFDKNAEKKAIQYQKRLQKIVDSHFRSNKQEKVAFWGSFGDVDMTIKEVILKYYDNIQSYREMQKLKKKVDPQGLFHSPMTVKLPS